MSIKIRVVGKRLDFCFRSGCFDVEYGFCFGVVWIWRKGLVLVHVVHISIGPRSKNKFFV